jgi:hypothetical protein
MRTHAQVAVIGAGPYGLAAAAHLRAARIETAVFGRTMDFWKNHMPAGMRLRSSWEASHISDPANELTLDRYHVERGHAPRGPVSLERFVEYGLWYKRQAVPDIDERMIIRIDPQGGGFRLLLDDGQTLQTQRVVVACGIGLFAHRPGVFAGLPPELASHSGDHANLQRFDGKTVLVIGAGQSAIESAALLSENGALVEVVMRRIQGIRWLHRREILRHPANPLSTVLFPPTDVGPPVLNQIVARPHWFRGIPSDRWQDKIAYRCIRPAASSWLKPRVCNVLITAGRNVASAGVRGGCVSIRLDDGSTRTVDHVLLATGYRVDVSRYPFLAHLTQSIRTIGGYPELSTGFESSIPGLHFLGAPAAKSFGPVMRFVSGTGYSASALASTMRGVVHPEPQAMDRLKRI